MATGYPGTVCALLAVLCSLAPADALGAEPAVRIVLPPHGDAPRPVVAVGEGTVAVEVVGDGALTRFRARLNGREVTPVFDDDQREGQLRRRARLGASDGLVHGLNRLEVAVTGDDGELIEDSRTLAVAADRPLVGAGRDRIVRVAHSVRLDGSDSAAAAPLRYSWKLLRAPEASNAQLLDRHTSRPLLVPDAPGLYEVRLRVSDGMHRSGWDTVIIRATDQPVTTELNTMATDGAGRLGIRVGAKFYPNDAAHQGLGVQALILDRQTLDQPENISVTTETDLSALRKRIDTLPRWTKLVMLSRPLAAAKMTKSEAATFNEIAEKLGGERFPDAVLETDTVAISVLGVPGFSSGQGYQAQRRSGSGIEGALMLDANAQFWAFTWTDYRSFSVSLGDPGEIVVDGQTFPLGHWNGNGGGFHLVQLDGGTLAVRRDDTFFTNSSMGAPQQSAMCDALKDALAAGTVALVASFGAPIGGGRSYDDLNCIVQRLQWLGGTAHVVAQLVRWPPTQYYALAAAGVRPRSAAFEASTLIQLPGAASAMKAQLTGVLGRNRLGWFTPLAADASGDITYEMFQVAYQSPSPWPHSSTPGDQGALCYITRQLGIGGTEDVRSLYPDTQGFMPDVAALNDVPFPSDPSCGAKTFTMDQFNAVKAQLLAEFADILTIRNFFDVVKVPFRGSTTIREFVELNVIADSITGALQASDGTDFLVDILGIVQSVLQIVSAIAPVVGAEPDDGGGVSAAVDAISALISMSEGIAQSADTGQPVDRIRARRDQLAKELIDSMEANLASFDRLQELIVSDWGKMRAVAAKALDPQEWLFSDPDLEQAVAAYDRGARFHFWSALMSAIYQRVEILPDVMYGPVDHVQQFPPEQPVVDWNVTCSCLFPFFPFGLAEHGAGELGQDWLFSGFMAGAPDDLLEYLNVWAVLAADQREGNWCTDTLPTLPRELADTLRKGPEEGGPGLYMPWFWNQFQRFQLRSQNAVFDLYPVCNTEVPLPG